TLSLATYSSQPPVFVASTQSPVERVCDELYRDPRIDPIRGKVQLSLDDRATVQMMANDSIPGPVEKAAILAWAEQRQSCQDYAAHQQGPAPPHFDSLRRANSQLMA
ncbi:unnamed protein product, partial [Phaeothamnion confervicola]